MSDCSCQAWIAARAVGECLGEAEGDVGGDGFVGERFGGGERLAIELEGTDAVAGDGVDDLGGAAMGAALEVAADQCAVVVDGFVRCRDG